MDNSRLFLWGIGRTYFSLSGRVLKIKESLGFSCV